MARSLQSKNIRKPRVDSAQSFAREGARGLAASPPPYGVRMVDAMGEKSSAARSIPRVEPRRQSHDLAPHPNGRDVTSHERAAEDPRRADNVLGTSAAPITSFTDHGKVGTGTAWFAGGRFEGLPFHGRSSDAAALESLSPATPTASRAFVDQGRGGRASVHWSGGGGGLNHWRDWVWTKPTISTAPPTGDGGQASAWIGAPGEVKLSREYIGVNSGPNNNYWITNAAMTRIDVHEQGHTDHSVLNHDNLVTPLETRIRGRLGVENAVTAATDAGARTALENEIDFDTTKTSFLAYETQHNAVMASWDQAELANPNSYTDHGAGAVSPGGGAAGPGVQYDHLIGLKTESPPFTS